MNAITYFKLRSPYEGDITKNCALTGSEVDNNFFTLEGRDIKSVELIDGKVVVNLMNGEKLRTDNITEDCIKGLTFDFDEVNGILTIVKDGVVQTISGFATNYNIGDAISVDGTLVGNGLSKTPVGISPVTKTGQYRPVKQIVKVVDGERLPSMPYVFPGDRYLTVESVNEYGYLYDYEGLKRIACQLRETHSKWRIPSKEDWDDMLDAVEPNEDFRNHTDARSNKYLGRFAGKFLKSKEFWKKDEHPCDNNDTCIDYSESDCSEECHCGRHIQCHPDYCGEYGTCHHRHFHDNRGLDKYGFHVVPAGYANEAKDFMYFKERAYFWTATNHEYRDAYIKSFVYNKGGVLQDVMAADNYMSVRLVKSFTGDNYNEREDILGGVYSTVLMPSMKHGKSIWTSVNISLGDCGCGCRHILPNDGQGMEYTKKYFVNEWTGKEWLRKEVLEGESVVVNNDHKEYRIVDGELIDVAGLTFDDVMETVTPILDNINNEIGTITENLDNEIERSTNKDAELESALNVMDERVTADEQNIANNTQAIVDINEHLTQTDNNVQQLSENLEQAVTEINAAIAEETEARTAKDAELEEAINTEREERVAEVTALHEEDARINERVDVVDEKVETEKTERQEADEVITAQLISQEGTEFDSETGTLTLKSKGGTNDVEVQFSFNFGTF